MITFQRNFKVQIYHLIDSKNILKRTCNFDLTDPEASFLSMIYFSNALKRRTEKNSK